MRSSSEAVAQKKTQHRTPHLDADDAPLWRRLLWMAALWVASVSVLGVVAYGIRLWLKG